MTVRARLTLWYAGVIFISLLAMGALTYREFAPEPHSESQEKAQEDESDLREVLHILFWCGVPSALLALCGGWWAHAQSPRARGKHSPGRPNASTSETSVNSCRALEMAMRFDRLTEVFNAMTARLNNSFIRIREFTLHASHELKNAADRALRRNGNGVAGRIADIRGTRARCKPTRGVCAASEVLWTASRCSPRRTPGLSNSRLCPCGWMKLVRDSFCRHPNPGPHAGSPRGVDDVRTKQS